MEKGRAFAIHLGVSAAVAGLATWIFMQLWFPLPYFLADGGWQGLRLLAGVDVVLGPFLTLIVYRRSKSRRALTFDYACIAILQLFALGLGLWTLYGQRTALVAFADGRFYTVDALTTETLVPGADIPLAVDHETPVYGVVRMPDEEEARQELRRETLQSGRPLYLRADLLDPLDPPSLNRIADRYPWSPSPEEEAATAELLARTDSTGMTSVLLPVACRYGRVLLAFDPATAKLIDWSLLGPEPTRREIRVSAAPL